MIKKKSLIAGVLCAMFVLGGCGKSAEIEEYGNGKIEATSETEGDTSNNTEEKTETVKNGDAAGIVYKKQSSSENTESVSAEIIKPIEWRDNFDVDGGKLKGDVYIDYTPVPVSKLPVYNYKKMGPSDINEEEIVKNLFGETAVKKTTAFDIDDSSELLNSYFDFYWSCISNITDTVSCEGWVDNEDYYFHTYEGTYKNVDCQLLFGYSYTTNATLIAMYPKNPGDIVDCPEYKGMGIYTKQTKYDYMVVGGEAKVEEQDSGSEAEEMANKCSLNSNQLVDTVRKFMSEELMIETCDDAFTPYDLIHDETWVGDPEIDVVFYDVNDELFLSENYDAYSGSFEYEELPYIDKNGYYVRLTNDIGGIGSFAREASIYRNYDYYDVAAYNQGGFYVNDDGIMGFDIIFDGWLTDKVAEDTTVLSFDNLKECFISEVSKNVDSSKISTNTGSLYFKDMTLIYYGIENPDNDKEGTMVPALWFTATEGTAIKLQVILNAVDGSLISIEY
jgi:hypothetical protein